MDLRWDYPVHKAASTTAAHGTTVEAQREALPREKALELVAGADERPLLVLRECKVCNKTDDALLSRTESNERTLILARFFHCVKLPVEVTQPDHPFFTLFPGDESEHLFVAAQDGTAKLPLESDTSRVELWAAMERTIAAHWKIDPSKVVKQVLQGLDRIDQIENKATQLEQRRFELMESSNADGARIKKLQDEIESLRKDAAAERAAVERLFTPSPRGASDAERR